MPVYIALLRAVNVGGTGQLRMETLRSLCEGLGHQHVHTYVQSGNIVFRSASRSMPALAKKIEEAIEEKLGFRPPVILRSLPEMRQIVEANPFAGREDIEPAKLAVNFLPADPGDAARAKVKALPIAPEEIVLAARELYIYFPTGMGRTKFPFNAVDRALAMQGTSRNWNSVTKLLAMAEATEKAG